MARENVEIARPHGIHRPVKVVTILRVSFPKASTQKGGGGIIAGFYSTCTCASNYSVCI